MSSVSGIGGLGGDPLQSLRQMMGQDPAAAGNRASQAAPTGAPPQPPLWAEIEESAETAGLDAEQIDALKADLKEAISSALEAVDRAEGPEAGREAIDNAILTTLQEYGIDTAELESHMEEAKTRMQGMRPPGQMPNMGGGSQTDGGLLASLTGLASEEDDATTLLSQLFPLIDEEA